MSHVQKFAYIVMVQDANGETEHLAWIDGTLNPESGFAPSASWMSLKEGDHTATMFVWESIENPSALSPPVTIEFVVISESMKYTRDASKGNHDEQFLHIIPQKEFKASNGDLVKMHFYKITDTRELSQLPLLNLLIDMAKDFPEEHADRPGLRITGGQLDEYSSFFTQKCDEQRPYAGADACSSTEWAFEYDEQWYFLHSQPAPHKSAMKDDVIERDPQ